MASQSLIDAVQGYENYILANGIDEQVIDAYVRAVEVAICNEKDVTYGFTIPKSFRWDGATIKPIFWLLIGSKTDARFKIPSLIHDYMCNNKYIVNFDRKFSSEVFKALLLVSGVSKFKAQIMFTAVDLFQMTQGWGK